LTSDGELFAPKRFKEIVRERFVITKHSNTSYGGINDMTPLERKYLLHFIIEDLKREKEIMDKYR